jgi:hypothetical protein
MTGYWKFFTKMGMGRVSCWRRVLGKNAKMISAPKLRLCFTNQFPNFLERIASLEDTLSLVLLAKDFLRAS